MTMLTVMTMFLIYPFTLSHEHRHHRHYRHARTVPGVWGTPQKCACGWPHAMLAKHVYPKTMTNKPDAHTNPYIPQSGSTVDSLKIFNSSEWINDRFTLPTEAKCRKNPANSPRVNQFRFIQKSWLEKMNQFWFTLQLELVLQNEEKSLVYGLFLCRTH